VLRDDYQNLGVQDGGLAADAAMAPRLALRRLWAGGDVEVVSTAWRRDLHAARSECRPAYAAIEIMKTGAFEKRTGRQRLLADAAGVVFHQAGEAFEILHPSGRANSGLTLRLGAAAMDAQQLPRGFRSQWAPSPASFAMEAHRLVSRLESEADDALAREEAVVLLVNAALDLDARGALRPPPSGTAAAHARAAQAFLNEAFARPVTLSDVARAAGCSVWHVCKQFRAATGTTIHAWLTRLRLRHALAALQQGAEDLTRVALEAGFSSHSHFTASFRGEFGVTPRDVRTRGPRAAL
jgi:AraC-like DNA-binding protein